MDDDIVIYDWCKWYCCKNWYWTVITRARYLNRVKFYKYDADENDMSKIRVETYFKNKIMNYEEQDKNAGRDVEDGNYVDVDFLMNLMNTQCEKMVMNHWLLILKMARFHQILAVKELKKILRTSRIIVGLCVQCNCAFSNKISL